jgi:nucleoid-associated protein YgaU
MMEMNFGAPAVKAGVAAAKAGTPGVGAAKSVNIDLGGAKNVAGAAKAVPAPIPYKWVAGDTLTALAEAFYGDQGLYPILVDANEAKLVLPENLKAGVIISIPRGVDDVTKAKAREKAIQPHYVQWKAAGK